MESSVADSTSLRMRSLLQRTHATSPNKTNQGLFEELLKVPASSTRCTTCKDPAPIDDDPLPISDLSASQPTANEPTAETEEAAEDEPTDDTTQSAESLVAHVQSAGVPIAQVDDDINASSSSTIELATTVPARDEATIESANAAPLGDASAGATTAQEISIDQTVNEVSQSADAAAQLANAAQLASAAGRGADRQETNDQTPAAAENSADSHAEIDVNADRASRANAVRQAGTGEATAPQSDQAAAAPISPTDPANGSDRDSRGAAERDKWYLPSAVSTTPADGDRAGSQEDDRESHLGDDAAAALANPNASDINPLDPEQLASDPSLSAIDPASLALAAQAAAAAASSTVSASNTSLAVEGASGSNRSTSEASPVNGRPGLSSTSSNAHSTSSTGQPSEAGEADAKQLTQQERVRLVQRVARSFSRLGPDGGQITLKLHPPQLGVLNLTVRMEGQTMTAKMQTESAAARDTILEHLPMLKERLAEQGIDVARFQVEISQSNDLANGQPSQTPFESDPRGGGRDDSSNIDYRRLGRAAADRDSALTTAARSWDSPAWQPRSPADRTLDVRA